MTVINQDMAKTIEEENLAVKGAVQRFEREEGHLPDVKYEGYDLTKIHNLIHEELGEQPHE